MKEVIICETPEDVADAAADLISESQRDAIDERGVFRIALSGGRTPKLLFEALASVEWRTVMGWEQWEVFWADERAVATNDPESNYRLAQEILLNKVPVAEIWRMHAELRDLPAAAEDYARTLKSRFDPGVPRFDTLLLGMGADGHTASLFPISEVLRSGRLVEAVEAPPPISRRLTLTMSVINAARLVLFLVTGEDKAETVLKVLKGNDLDLPAAQVDPEEGQCLWLLDHAAARLIR
jgi:6-phosphogluconolactonase